INFLPGGDQYNFIKHDLETVNRTKTPFVVVQGHRPMYTTSDEYRDAPLRSRMLEHYKPLFVNNKVTLEVWGHVHRYESFTGVHYDWDGGTRLANLMDTPDQVFPIFPQPEISLFRTGEFGYTRLFATKEKLTITFLGSHDGEPHDMVEILDSGNISRRSEDASWRKSSGN
ncbi:hypothetical protein MKX03_002338, partial [Papaver bracteatum]